MFENLGKSMCVGLCFMLSFWIVSTMKK
jgi:hypothetical protein